MSEPDSEAVLHYTCPGCQANLRARNTDSGTRRTCPQCGKTIKVPGIPVSTRTSSRTTPAEKESATSTDVAQAVTPTGPKIVFSCPQCQNRLMASPDQSNQSILCEECLETVVVPANTTMAPTDSSEGQTTAALPSATSPVVSVPSDDEKKDRRQPPPQQESAGNMETFIPKSFTIICAVCGTRLYAHLEQVGTRIPCPDCYATTTVRSPKPVKRRRPKPKPASETATRETDLKKTVSEIALEDAKKEVRQETEAIHERESKTRFENLFHFMLFPDMILRFMVFSLLFTITTFLFVVAREYHDGLMAALGMFLSTGGLVLGTITLLVALPTAVVIVIETGNGNYEVNDLPGINFMEAFGHTLFILTSLLVSLVPYVLLSRVAALTGGGSLVAQLVVQILCGSLFPLILLSALESHSPVILWSSAIYESIVEKPDCWIGFWFTCALLLTGQWLLQAFVIKHLPFRLLLSSSLSVFVVMVYFRAVGLLAWQASKIFSPESE